MLLDVFDRPLLFALCARRPLLISTVSTFSSCWIRFWLNRDRYLTISLEQVYKSHSLKKSLLQITELEKIYRATVKCFDRSSLLAHGTPLLLVHLGQITSGKVGSLSWCYIVIHKHFVHLFWLLMSNGTVPRWMIIPTSYKFLLKLKRFSNTQSSGMVSSRAT